MLVLARKIGQQIEIQELGIVIKVVDVRTSGTVRIGLIAPKEINIARSELLESKKQEVLSKQETLKSKLQKLSPNSLVGKTIAVVGTLKGHSKKEIETLIAFTGGKLSNTVSKDVNYLIVGEEAKKLDKARELGIPVLTEDEFDKLIET